MQSSFKFVQPLSSLTVMLRPRVLIPAAMAVLITACSVFPSKEKEAANALAQALNPPTAPRGDNPAPIMRGTEDFAVKGVAEQQVNRDVSGKSLSVVVRIFQLRDKNEFSRLSFDAVTSRSDAELFPKELVAASEVVVMPGTMQEVTDKLLPETKYVGVVGYFRKPDAQFWRFLFDAQAIRKEGLIFVAKDCHFTAITPKSEPLPGQTESYTPTCTGIIPPVRSVPPSRSRR
ncbi:MAG: type VI secretion system lipoprotein TssJ [Betaproteobacteria bacterium]|nr:type VI secretion system lipoprotein TssJ [Betaproteobacteria bacterium]